MINLERWEIWFWFFCVWWVFFCLWWVCLHRFRSCSGVSVVYVFIWVVFFRFSWWCVFLLRSRFFLRPCNLWWSSVFLLFSRRWTFIVIIGGLVAWDIRRWWFGNWRGCFIIYGFPICSGGGWLWGECFWSGCESRETFFVIFLFTISWFARSLFDCSPEIVGRWLTGSYRWSDLTLIFFAVLFKARSMTFEWFLRFDSDCVKYWLVCFVVLCWFVWLDGGWVTFSWAWGGVEWVLWRYVVESKLGGVVSGGSGIKSTIFIDWVDLMFNGCIFGWVVCGLLFCMRFLTISLELRLCSVNDIGFWICVCAREMELGGISSMGWWLWMFLLGEPIPVSC